MEKGTGWGGGRESLFCALASDMAAGAYQGRLADSDGRRCLSVSMCSVWRRKGKSWDGMIASSEQVLSWRILHETIVMDVGIRPIKPNVADVARAKAAARISGVVAEEGPPTNT